MPAVYPADLFLFKEKDSTALQFSSNLVRKWALCCSKIFVRWKETEGVKGGFRCGFSSLLQLSESSMLLSVALQVAMDRKITFSYKLNRFS
jgi:hypothetical protein